MKPETVLRRKILVMIKAEFPGIWIYHPADRWLSGVPDFIICWRGFFVAIEVKTPVGRVTKLQRHILNKIKEAHGVAAEVRSVDEARKVLKGCD
jgi:hypothetical protein